MRKLTLTSLLVVLLSMAATAPAFATTDPRPDSSAEQDFLSLVNQERTSRGLRALTWSSRIASIARDHSDEMARRGELYHNDDLPDDVGSYSALAENVGVGGDVASIHEAFMDSSGHRHNVLGSFTQIGMGVMVDEGGSMWVTEVFYTPAQSSSSSQQQASSTTTSRTSGSRVTSTVRRARYRAAATAIREVPVPRVARRAVVIAEPVAVRTVGALQRLAGTYA